MPGFVERAGDALTVSAGRFEASMNLSYFVLRQPFQHLLMAGRGIGKNLVVRFACRFTRGFIEIQQRHIQCFLADINP